MKKAIKGKVVKKMVAAHLKEDIKGEKKEIKDDKKLIKKMGKK